MAPLQLSIDDYVCHDDSSIDAPIGITSDVELLVESAVSCFYEWTLGGRLHVEEIFALLDSDNDGLVSGQDVADHHLDGGHFPEGSRANALRALPRR
ncbi:hypothetical protein PI124_g1231 [Phytophthora idaei]|nr:hypothetical protein PI125_g7858 [Phytophthora idaei]KAG3146035.1 hypothetical protein PI126_g13498 [Phytophthora idaei]KAG3254265.1 hypothetical protein PI124_g1231 [Phytophthora idaei]